MGMFILGQLMLLMRFFTGFGPKDWWPSGLIDTDKFKSTLVMMGDRFMGTGPHYDWAEALNVAFGIKGHHNPLRPVAWWLFVLPSAVQELHGWLIHDEVLAAKFPQGLDSFKRDAADQRYRLPLLTKEEMDRIVEGLGAHKARVVPHFAGHIMRVKAGWLHAVINEQPCVKIAFDTIQPSMFPLYAGTRRFLFQRFGTYMAADYTGWLRVAFRCATSFQLPVQTCGCTI